MFGRSDNNNQCLLILLLGVALLLLMTRPQRKTVNRENFIEAMAEASNASSNNTASEVPVTSATPATDNGPKTVVVKIPEQAPINEQSVVTLPRRGIPPVEVLPGTPYVNARTNTLVDGPGYARYGKPYDGTLCDTVPADYYMLDDGAGGEMSATNNMFSPSCCGAQWPTPFQQSADPYTCGAGGKGNAYPNSRTYGNTAYTDSGCACVSSAQNQFLQNRGNNGSPWF